MGPDLREFMFNNAQKRRATLRTKIAAITGSNGKTTVKEMLASINDTYVSVANQNTKLALALQILRIPAETPYAVFEMGARCQGDFQTPFSYVRPHVVTLLNIGSAHAGEFGSLENLIKEKLSVLEFSSTEKSVVFADDERVLSHAKKYPSQILSFGYSHQAQFRIVVEDVFGVQLKTPLGNFLIESSYSGPEKALNFAAAFATAYALGFTPAEILKGLKVFQGVERRFQPFTWQNRRCIDDAFNASPESMKAGLQHLARTTKGQKTLLVLGDMLELGDVSEAEHAAIGELILKTFPSPLPQVVTIGEKALAIYKGLQGKVPAAHFANAQEAKDPIISLAKNADVIYFKASKSLQLHSIFKAHE
jgi:UDP-N-acetylmuramoyl-tripeptide--D-alanyl-D-alanine ligase